MVTIIIPPKIAKGEELIAIPRKEYETLVELKRMKEFTPTVAHRRALEQAEENLRRKKTLSYNELVKKLGFTD